MSVREDEGFIRFENVWKAFGSNAVYEDLSLSIHRGETLTILGPSGSGKTVLIKMLIGLIKPDAGHIRFDGIDVVPLTEEQILPIRRRISMLFQGGALFDSITVGENVAYPLREHGGIPKEEIASRVRERLALVGLEHTEHFMPSELSGGMRKRVALARAVAGEPEALLYDEPTTGLDPINVRRIDELIVSIQRRLNVTSIVVTHDLDSAVFVSHRIALLYDRQIVAVLPKDEFMRSRDERIQDFVNAMPRSVYMRPEEAPLP